ncbi:MAG: hypothetical protein D6743_13465 [Calditrichaeota bacterium]|nr:MAG: hypothetical protein D6743_13465 [Calditrichota bacterium]
MQITEPTTMVTDYLLALLTIFLGAGLWKRGKATRQRSISLWSAAFLATAVAAAVGGTSHGFALYLSDWGRTAIWKATVYAIGLASLLMLAGTVLATTVGRARKILLTAAVLQFLLYAVWMVSHDDFKYVIYDYAPAMLVIIALMLFSFVARKAASAPWLIGGILLSFAAAGIQQSGFSLHPNFNFNDLYHVVQMGAMIVLYRGARQLQDR